MKKALISPKEPRQDTEGNDGYRVAFVGEQEFDVAPPLFWIECPDDCVQDFWVYVDGQFKDNTPPPVVDVIETKPVIDTLTDL